MFPSSNVGTPCHANLSRDHHLAAFSLSLVWLGATLARCVSMSSVPFWCLEREKVSATPGAVSCAAKGHVCPCASLSLTQTLLFIGTSMVATSGQRQEFQLLPHETEETINYHQNASETSTTPAGRGGNSVIFGRQPSCLAASGGNKDGRLTESISVKGFAPLID